MKIDGQAERVRRGQREEINTDIETAGMSTEQQEGEEKAEKWEGERRR